MFNKTEWLKARKKYKIWGIALLVAVPFQLWPMIPLPLPAQLLGPTGNLFVSLVFLVVGGILTNLGFKDPSDKLILEATEGTSVVDTAFLIRTFDLNHERADSLIRDLIEQGSISLSHVAEQNQGWATVQVLESFFKIKTETAEHILLDAFLGNQVNIVNRIGNDSPISAWACKYVGINEVQVAKPDVARDVQMNLDEFTSENDDMLVSDINRALLSGGMNFSNSEFAF